MSFRTQSGNHCKPLTIFDMFSSKIQMLQSSYWKLLKTKDTSFEKGISLLQSSTTLVKKSDRKLQSCTFSLYCYDLIVSEGQNFGHGKFPSVCKPYILQFSNFNSQSLWISAYIFSMAAWQKLKILKTEFLSVIRAIKCFKWQMAN